MKMVLKKYALIFSDWSHIFIDVDCSFFGNVEILR